MENSKPSKAVDEATREISDYVEKIKKIPEMEGVFMTMGDKMDMLYEEGIAIGEKRGQKRGIAIGEKRGFAMGEEQAMFALYHEGIIDIEILKEKLHISEEEVYRKMKAFGKSKENKIWKTASHRKL